MAEYIGAYEWEPTGPDAGQRTFDVYGLWFEDMGFVVHLDCLPEPPFHDIPTAYYLCDIEEGEVCDACGELLIDGPYIQCDEFDDFIERNS